MKTTLGTVRRLIAETLNEFWAPTGALRRSSSKTRQVKAGKIEEENKQVSVIDAELTCPGSTDAWAEVVPDMFPEFPFADNPRVVKTRSDWFKVGAKLRVGFKEMPGVELAEWDAAKEDWFPLEGI